MTPLLGPKKVFIFSPVSYFAIAFDALFNVGKRSDREPLFISLIYLTFSWKICINFIIFEKKMNPEL